ncbi:MAG TPA: hypothetical protein VMF86_07650 [Stellaceae bacterium]|nr:hypothetical protein [Stellaceae bacterium]
MSSAAVQRRRDDIRIVDLAPGDAMGRKDADRAIEDTWPFFGNAERRAEPSIDGSHLTAPISSVLRR